MSMVKKYVIIADADIDYHDDFDVLPRHRTRDSVCAERGRLVDDPMDNVFV